MPLAVGDYMFGNYPADNVQAAVLANYATEKGFKTAYVLKSPDTAYTLKLPEYFATSFKGKGGQVIGEGTYSMGQQDFSAEVTKIKAMNPAPDVIMTAAYEPDFPAFIRQLRGAGVATPILGSDGIDSPTTFGLGPLVDGVVFTTAGFAAEGSPLAAFNAKYKAKYGQDPDTVYIANGYDLGKVIEAAVTKADSVESTAIRDAIWARMDEVLEEELAAKDTSVPLDAIGKDDHVRLTYVPGMNGLSPEDVMIKAVDRVCSAETVILDERLIPLFVMANVDRDAFVDFVREDKGIDLTQAGFDESWSDYRRAEEEARAASWRDATWTTDPDKPELVSKEDLFLILGESSYGGVPSLTISVPLKQFIERDWSLPLVIEPATIRDSGKTRTVAGQLGLHDFVWGSGYTITNSSPITIPPDSLKDWCVSEKTGHGFDKVYDMVGWAYRAGVKDGEPAPEAELQAPTP